jgi:hypothetical protein
MGIEQLGGLPPGERAGMHRDQGQQSLLGVAQCTDLRAGQVEMAEQS